MSTVNTKKALMEAAKDFLTANSSINVVGEGLITGLPTIPSGDIGWENRTFKPEGKNPWASVFYRPNNPTTRTVGQRGYDQLTGFVQIDFNIAPSKGSKILTEWEDKARIYFHPGRSFNYDGQGVIVTICGMSAGRHVENFYRKSLTVAFRSQIKRNEVV
jgi:hypothetical protein